MAGTIRAGRVVRLLLCLALVGSLASACGSPSVDGAAPDDPAAADRGFVGSVEGTDAFVAILAGGDEIVAYVCDGEADIGEWFKGVAAASGIDLGNDRGARLEATLSGAVYVGTVTLPGGDRHDFTTEPAVAGSGLLRVTGAEAQADGVTAGWIVDNDGQQRGSLRVRGRARTAPSVPGPAVAVDGKDYPVSVFLVPAKPPPAPAPFVPVPYPNIGQVVVKGR